METRANYVIVGIFTLFAILAAFAFVYWTAAIGERGETATLRVRIPGSASGLARGSFVLFNGVKVGDVRRVYLDVSNPQVAIADAEIDRLTPITQSTQADIGLAGLTGQANIELKGANIKEPNLLDKAEADGTVAEIVANPSAVTNLLQTAQDIFKRADTVLNNLEGFTNDVRGPLTATVGNAQKFSESLARNADGVDKFLASVSALSEQLSTVSGKLDGTIEAAEGLLKSVDRDKVKNIVASVDTFTKNLSAQSDQIDDIVKGVNTTVASINDFAQKTQQTLSKVDGVLEGVDAASVKESLDNIRKASENANKAAADVAKVTDKFGDRADDIDQIVSDAKQLASRLNQASVRVDGVLAKVDKLLGSGEAEGVMSDASATLKAFKQVADTLNARLGTITDGLARFSGQGLRDVESLVQDSRRSITRIEQAISDLERNPQRIITGGEGTVREFDGRVRR
ncbi:MlaD family protein [Aminobacter sp. P9b]|uniref:Phospholipid/cholesterol/gamma-HCH transport system substrate-binding protein n=1 Tax=Aminobacter niigataensis TaxID=83265 RepID=A0ABR6KX01_9HYPH|nr:MULTISPECIES: MlaD family protein [Aminobacter]AWC23814.1 virulence factor Mce family protein [Aminobacter sp. MSH1]MBB4649058.1 phospholipid/cholesterol/gamma-HCH transport system substrate-binding protein [Aminobacter niigataensis]CAI2934498.1 Virulence factor Mce family protein [Aminobacter niigataensis]